MKYIIDYFMFRIKPDQNVHTPYAVSLNDILRLLDITAEEFNSFVNLGAHNFYDRTYHYNCVRIYESNEEHYAKMGYCVELSGQGCRYIESLYYKHHKTHFSWFAFINGLYRLVGMGCDLNINRIDFAFDDFNGLLQLDEIERSLLNRECVTLFRSIDLNSSYDATTFQVPEGRIDEHITRNYSGKTIYLGSKRSNAYCRFYDKKSEQIYRHKNDKDKVTELENIPHWVRFEMVFKRASALKIISALQEINDESKFISYLCGVINTYFRFINLDDSNVSRCSIKAWWSKFIGTAARAKLTTCKYVKNYFDACHAWIKNTLSNTLQAFIEAVSPEVFLEMIENYSNKAKWKSKHYDIRNKETHENTAFLCNHSSSGVEKLALMIPQDAFLFADVPWGGVIYD